jgi:hypothetical protein
VSLLVPKYFLQVLAGVTNANIIVDPHGVLPIGVEHRVPFIVSDADYGLDVFMLCPKPESVDFQLETPGGDRISPSSLGGTTAFLSRGTAAFYRASLPAIPAEAKGSHGGVWYAVLKIGRPPIGSPDIAPAAASQGVLPYDVLVHCYSNLVFRAHGVQSSYEPGSAVQLVASLREYDVPVERRARVWAEIRRPNGSFFDVAFDEVAGGQFTAAFATPVAGLYQARVRARGETFSGAPFTREQTVSAVVTPRGNTGPTVPPRDTVGELLCCLLSSGALNEEMLKRLLGGRVKVDAVLRCLKRLCAERSRPREGSGRKSTS